MGLKLHEAKSDGTIPVREMEPGQVGIITEFGVSKQYVGNVVQKQKGSTYLRNLTSGDGWTNVMSNNDSYRVRILPPGTLLEVE
jgi:hypothetical protein